jgi:hypothetical protein
VEIREPFGKQRGRWSAAQSHQWPERICADIYAGIFFEGSVNESTRLI